MEATRETYNARPKRRAFRDFFEIEHDWLLQRRVWQPFASLIALSRRDTGIKGFSTEASALLADGCAVRVNWCQAWPSLSGLARLRRSLAEP